MAGRHSWAHGWTHLVLALLLLLSQGRVGGGECVCQRGRLPIVDVLMVGEQGQIIELVVVVVIDGHRRLLLLMVVVLVAMALGLLVMRLAEYCARLLLLLELHLVLVLVAAITDKLQVLLVGPVQRGQV